MIRKIGHSFIAAILSIVFALGLFVGIGLIMTWVSARPSSPVSFSMHQYEGANVLIHVQQQEAPTNVARQLSRKRPTSTELNKGDVKSLEFAEPTPKKAPGTREGAPGTRKETPVARKKAPVTRKETPITESSTSSIIDLRTGSKELAPRLKHGETSLYPDVEYQLGVEGDVVLSFEVLKDGSVHEISVVDGNFDLGFVNSAVQMVKTWQFEPLNEDTTFIMPFYFRLN